MQHFSNLSRYRLLWVFFLVEHLVTPWYSREHSLNNLVLEEKEYFLFIKEHECFEKLLL